MVYPEGGRGKVGDKGERWEGVCPIRRVAEEGLRRQSGTCST